MLKHLDEELSSEVYRFNKVHGIILFRADGTLLFETGYEQYRPDDLERLRLAAQGTAQNMFWATIATLRGARCIVLARTVNSADAIDSSIGSLLIMVDEGLFARETFRDVDFGPKSELLISSAEGTVISASRSRFAPGARIADTAFLSDLRRAAEDSAAVEYDGWAGRSLVRATSVEIADWIVAARIPSEDVAAVSTQVTRNVVLVCAALLLVITVLASWIFMSISGPLARLSLAASALRSGDFSKRLDDPFRDEVGELSRIVDETAERLALMVEEIRQGQEEKRAAEMEMLKSQISPHFLFNTLDSLKWTAMLRGDAPVAEGIGALSSLLRGGALAAEAGASLEQELENLKSYALVMKLRYGESFRLVVDASDSALPCRLPRLLLQPLVENAIVHGVSESSLAIVTIAVRASVEPRGGVPSLVVVVEDDGRGFDSLAGAESGGLRFKGIGLRNVSERLRLSYGESAGLSISSEIGRGARAEIWLPASSPGREAPCIA
jgi:Predicted signal transduction protein with a C-terminal ATPase domain